MFEAVFAVECVVYLGVSILNVRIRRLSTHVWKRTRELRYSVLEASSVFVVQVDV